MTAENGDAPQAQEIVRVEPKQLSRRDPFKVAEAFARSKYFPSVDTIEKAVVIIIAGEEIGIGAMAAMQGITIIEGKVGYMGNLVATLIKKHPVYDYRVKEKTDQKCEIEFGPAPAPGRDETGGWLPWPDMYGASEFSVEDAKRAELVKPKSNWAKYPRAMCFNRALTEGARAYIPDVTAGAPAYTDDEIREVIPVEATVEGEATPQAAPGKLSAERVAHLIEDIEIAKPALAETGVNWLDGLNVLLGSLGIDGFKTDEALEDALPNLTAEQADQLDEALQAIAEEEADKAERDQRVESEAAK